MFTTWDARNSNASAELVSSMQSCRMARVDVLINNAGINAIKKFEDLDQDFITEIMQVNFVAPVLLTQALLKAGMFHVGTVVCNVISDAAWRPMRHSLAYNCSKAALDMATKQMARELTKPYGLTIFGVRPGKMRGTGMSNYIDRSVCELRGWTSEEADAYFRTNSLTGIEFEPTAVAQFIYQLCTTSMPISGACIDLAG